METDEKKEKQIKQIKEKKDPIKIEKLTVQNK